MDEYLNSNFPINPPREVPHFSLHWLHYGCIDSCDHGKPILVALSDTVSLCQQSSWALFVLWEGKWSCISFYQINFLEIKKKSQITNTLPYSQTKHASFKWKVLEKPFQSLFLCMKTLTLAVCSPKHRNLKAGRECYLEGNVWPNTESLSHSQEMSSLRVTFVMILTHAWKWRDFHEQSTFFLKATLKAMFLPVSGNGTH